MDRNTAEILWDREKEEWEREWEIRAQQERRKRRQERMLLVAEREQRRRKIQRLKRKKRRQRMQLITYGAVLFSALMILAGAGKYLIKRSPAFSGAGAAPAEHEMQQDPETADVWKGRHEIVGSGNEDAIQDYPAFCELAEVERPVKREMWEVLERLEMLAGENERIAEIFEDRNGYSDKMLEALANNPEMADFVAKSPDASPFADGEITQSEREQAYPLFLQWDPRWGYVPYGDGSNIGLAGCGPTCLSMALFYLTGDETYRPDRIAEYSMDNGYYVPGTGTQWALIDDVPKKCGLKVRKPGISESIMKRALDEGSIIICAMRQGDFTASGHFIVIYGYDEDGFRVNDPNCVARSRKSWTFGTLKSQIKQLWSIAAA